MAKLLEILIANSPAAPMTSVAECRAVPGRGLDGDRYFHGRGTFSPAIPKPDYELTLIESEAVAAYVTDSGQPFAVAEARRNLVTAGVRLNDLVGREFTVGDVRVRGVRLCEPCNHLAKITRPDVLRGLIHRGGLRAQIVSEGMLRRGDEIGLRSATRHAGYLISDDPTLLDV